MSKFKFGDYVSYNAKTRWLPQTGRFVRYCEFNPGYALVCFHGGCTPSRCSVDYLIPKEPTEDDKAAGYGFHRFDDNCPEFNPNVCSLFCPQFAKSDGDNCG